MTGDRQAGWLAGKAGGQGEQTSEKGDWDMNVDRARKRLQLTPLSSFSYRR